MNVTEVPAAADAISPLSILLAEDHDEFRELLACLLEADGARVQAVHDGVAALATLRSARHRFDVVVSDVRMPGKSGIDLLHALRADGCTLPVILLTGFGESVARSQVEAAEGAVLIEKPFDFDDLRTALRNLSLIARLRCR